MRGHRGDPQRGRSQPSILSTDTGTTDQSTSAEAEMPRRQRPSHVSGAEGHGLVGGDSGGRGGGANRHGH